MSPSMPSAVGSRRGVVLRRHPRLVRACLALASTLATLLLLAGGLKIYAWHLGIRDPLFLREYEIPVFRPDPELGYRTVPNLSLHCFGTVKIETNEQGFRQARAVSPEKAAGTQRLVGVGDSVMWGVGVNASDTFLAKLGQKLNQTGRWEVINAGVLGYSTLQESIFLERDILPLRPDVVIVNFCENDLLPGDDPFGNMRRVYLRQVEAVRDDSARPPSAEERARLGRLAEWCAAPRVKEAYDFAPADMQDYAWEVWVGRPMRRMAEAARAGGVRLVYVFIPSHHRLNWHEPRNRRWKTLLSEAGAEWLDVSAIMSAPDLAPPITKPGLFREAWWFPRTLDGILLQRRIEQVHRHNQFIDQVHPTRLGNELVAEHLFRFLIGRPLAAGMEAHRLAEEASAERSAKSH